MAAVGATSRYLAEDALEQIVVDYEPLVVVADPRRAMEAGSPLLFEERNNVVFQRVFAWERWTRSSGGGPVFTESSAGSRGSQSDRDLRRHQRIDPVERSATCHGGYQSPSFMGSQALRSLGCPPAWCASSARLTAGASVARPAPGARHHRDAVAEAGGRPVKWIEDPWSI